MIRHYRVGANPHRRQGQGIAQDPLECFVVRGLVEQWHSRHAAIQDVKDQSAEGYPRCSWHRTDLSRFPASLSRRTVRQAPNSGPVTLLASVDERTGQVEACPSGQVPLVVERDASAGMTRIEMAASACEGCPFRASCPIHTTRDGRYTMEFSDKEHRLAGRRREQETPVFAERYVATSGDRV